MVAISASLAVGLRLRYWGYAMANGNNSQAIDSKHGSFFKRIFSAGTQGVIQTAGLIFTFAAAIAFFYGITKLITVGGTKNNSGDFDFWRDLVGPNFDIFAIVAIGLICALFAVRLFSKAGSLTSQVIRPEDRNLLEPLISDAKKDAISEYIRLASLSGFSGTFTKLGFTGLPLATVGLTLLLLATAIYVKDPELKKSIFDMAKLTLGAFLGSFVQRNIEQEKLVAGPQRNAGAAELDAAKAEAAKAEAAKADAAKLEAAKAEAVKTSQATGTAS